MIKKTGSKAPKFKGKNQDGKEISLDDFKGKKLVLYFYPHDDTPTCTNQACNLRDNYKKLKKAGYEIIGVSEDDEKKHRKFIDKYNLPFDLIADTNHKIHKAYGVWDWKTTFGKTYEGTLRTTFLINENGVIEEVIEKVKSKEHSTQIIDTLKK